jgi:hypothetical protein
MKIEGIAPSCKFWVRRKLITPFTHLESDCNRCRVTSELDDFIRCVCLFVPSTDKTFMPRRNQYIPVKWRCGESNPSPKHQNSHPLEQSIYYSSFSK